MCGWIGVRLAGCSYDIRLNGGLSHIVHATCTDTPLGKTDGWLLNVQYTMNDYDENIASVVTLLFVSAVISVWALCTVGSDACCGFCCTGPNRCGLLMVPNCLAACLGSAAGVLYLVRALRCSRPLRVRRAVRHQETNRRLEC